jgi:hypothetical protein
MGTGAFAVDGGAQRTIGAGEFHSIPVSFRPTTLGASAGEVALGFSQGPRFQQLRGEGITAQQVTESFVPPAQPRVDVLFSVSPYGGGTWNFEDAGTNALNSELRSRMAAAVDNLNDAGVDSMLASSPDTGIARCGNSRCPTRWSLHLRG